MTREQAINSKVGDVLHFNGWDNQSPCTASVGPRGGYKETVCRVRVNGKCKTWKTRPGAFCLPVKRGLRDCGYVTERTADSFHVEEECPLYKPRPVGEEGYKRPQPAQDLPNACSHRFGFDDMVVDMCLIGTKKDCKCTVVDEEKCEWAKAYRKMQEESDRE